MTEPEKVRELLATPPDQMEEVAKRIEVPLPIARDLRMQAMNLLLGRCVLCEKTTMAGMCHHCRKRAPERRLVKLSRWRLLRNLKFRDPLLRRVCESCDRVFVLTVGYAIKMLSQTQNFTPAKTCLKCVRNSEAEQQRALAAQEAAKKKAEARKPGAPLLHKPFAGHLELMKLHNALPQRQRQPKGLNKAKNMKKQALSRE